MASITRTISAATHNPLVYSLVFACWMGYVVLSLISPTSSSNSYHLTGFAFLGLRLTIFIPILIIWLVATRGALMFKKYSLLVRHSAESPALSQIADGLLWIIGYLVITSLVGAALPYFTDLPAYNSLLIARDHIPALITLIAFSLLYLGSHQLKNVASFSTWTRGTMWAFLGYAVFAIVFVLAFSANIGAAADRVAPRTSTSILPPTVLLFTLVLPYLAAWFMGLLAGINIVKFSTRVKGVIYRQALKNLVRGIWGIVVFAMVLQILSFTARFLLGLNLPSLLAVVYALLALYALGFAFIFSGAKKLARIEVLE